MSNFTRGRSKAKHAVILLPGQVEGFMKMNVSIENVANRFKVQ